MILEEEDTALLDWFEMVKAQCWYDKEKGWTVFVVVEGGGYPVQPTRATLREAMRAAYDRHCQRD